MDRICNGTDHWTIAGNGERLWSLADECIVHGTGREWR